MNRVRARRRPDCVVVTGMVAALGGVVAPDAAVRAEDLSFIRHVISTTNTGIRCVRSADLDGDFDRDVITAVTDDHLTLWYENDGGSPPSFTEHVIDSTLARVNFVVPADLDGDQDIDILACGSQANLLVWYENDGGTPPTFTRNTIAGFLNGPRQCFAADVDGDSHIDVGGVSADDDTAAWFKSDGAPDPTFSVNLPILTVFLDGVRAVDAADIDGDSDIDIIAGPWYDASILWYENDGNDPASFTERILYTYPVNGDPDAIANVWRVLAADIDNDDDLDVLVARRFEGIEWLENDGGTPPQFTQVVLAPYDDAQVPKSVFAADLDNDGDIDPMHASSLDDMIAWYENDGAAEPTFVQRVITEDPDAHAGPLEGIADGARSVFADDIDGDDDLDILWAARDSNTVAWEENLLIGPPPNLCPTDFDNDGFTGVADLLLLLGSWGQVVFGPPDADGGGTANIVDLLMILGAWGPCPTHAACGNGTDSCYLVSGSPGCNEGDCCEVVCATRPLCCTSGWDVICKEMAIVMCGQCGDPAAGACCEANGSPGCEDINCCRDVCATDAFCCGVQWDDMCATEAASLCTCP